MGATEGVKELLPEKEAEVGWYLVRGGTGGGLSPCWEFKLSLPTDILCFVTNPSSSSTWFGPGKWLAMGLAAISGAT